MANGEIYLNSLGVNPVTFEKLLKSFGYSYPRL